MFEGRQLFDDQMIMFEGSKRVIAGITSSVITGITRVIAGTAGYCWHRGLLLASRVIAGIVGC